MPPLLLSPDVALADSRPDSPWRFCCSSDLCFLSVLLSRCPLLALTDQPSSWVISLGDSLVLLSRPQSRFLSFLRWRSPDGSWLEGFVPDCDSVVVQGCFVYDVGCDCDSRKLLFRGSLLPAGGGGQFLTWVIPSA
ncbi:hypothetical protein Dimus_036744 [Dionaea muscipula]